MAKVYLVCGKICSGKSYYAKKLKEKVNGVILSPDEATYDLIDNMQGEFYDTFSKKLLDYLNKKAVEIVKANANVIYERGLWTKEERDAVKDYFKENNVDFELHYINVSDEVWKRQIEIRNKKCQEGKGGSDFYLDEGLMKKLIANFQEPSKDEVDVWYDNNYQ